jgi:hypothetical protein
MITRNIASIILTACAVVCLHTIDAAQRRTKAKKEQPGGTMSLAELHQHKNELTTVIDGKTGQWYNETIFSSDDLPSFGTDGEGPLKEPTCVVTRGQLQAVVAKSNACMPAITGTVHCLATGNPIPFLIGIATSKLCALATIALNDNSDVATEEIETRNDFSTIIDAVEHDRWAKQHPRLSALRKRGGPHLKTE